jgi:dinuclear metal center YbgI/SA1388 family protein
MKVGEILDFINEIAPWKYAEEWDNVGLMLGGRSNLVNKLMVCLDVTSETIREAIDQKADLIVSHHPFLFSKLNTIDLDSLKGRQISELISNGIGVISAHTNLDFAPEGVNDTLAQALGLTGVEILKSYIPKGLSTELGMGKIGKLPVACDFDGFIGSVKKSLGTDNLRIIGTRPQLVKSAAVFCGSFDGDLEAIRCSGADVLVTGDIKYHTALDAVEMGLCIIDAGHFATENLIVGKLKATLENRFADVEIVCSKMGRDPFIFA